MVVMVSLALLAWGELIYMHYDYFPFFLSSGLRKYAILDLNPITKYSYESQYQGDYVL